MVIPQSLPESVDAALSELRWRGDTADCAELLRAIGDFPSYWIVLVDGRMATAPDDRNRVLAAVFTSEQARNLFFDALPESVANGLSLKEVLEMNGRDLFAQLGAMALDGIVFNCSGPGQPLAFLPEMSRQVQNVVASKPAADFDALVSVAFPDQEMGPIPAMNALWRACFALKEWVFVVHPKSAADPRPYITTEAGYTCMFAFTDNVRARRFAGENDLLGQAGDAVVLCVNPAAVIDWGRKELSSDLRLHFNFGGPGWFSPLKDVPRIHAYVQAHPD